MDLIYCFENIAISIFPPFGLKLPFLAHVFMVLGGFDTLSIFLSSKPSKGTYFGESASFIHENPSTCFLLQAITRKKEGK